MQRLKAEIEAPPDKTPGELKEELNLPCNESELSRIVREKPNFRRKKEGRTTKDRFLFLEYLREDLMPCLKEGDIVVMDNLKFHHTKGVEELLRSAGAVPLCLTPYSPDFNPIEKMPQECRIRSRHP